MFCETTVFLLNNECYLQHYSIINFNGGMVNFHAKHQYSLPVVMFILSKKSGNSAASCTVRRWEGLWLCHKRMHPTHPHSFFSSWGLTKVKHFLHKIEMSWRILGSVKSWKSNYTGQWLEVGSFKIVRFFVPTVLLHCPVFFNSKERLLLAMAQLDEKRSLCSSLHTTSAFFNDFFILWRRSQLLFYQYAYHVITKLSLLPKRNDDS